MKILILTSGIFPDSYSGIPKLVFYLAKSLQQRGHRIIVLTRKYEPNHLSFENYEGMDYYRVFIPKRGNTLYQLWPFVMIMKSIIWQRKLKKMHTDFDLVWVNNPWWQLFSNPKKLWPNAKLVYDFHSDATSEILFSMGESIASKFIGFIYDFIAGYYMKKSADSIIAHSWYSFNNCVSIYGEKIKSKISVIPGGADEHLYYPASNNDKQMLRKKLKLPIMQHNIITVRGLKKRTGVDQLIYAAHKLKKNNTSFHLTIVGSGPLKEFLQNEIQRLALTDHVTMASNLTETELADYYRASDIFILPTQGAEGFGLATVEALTSGLVALGTNNSATPEILNHYESNWIIHGTNSDDIFQKIFDYCTYPEKYFIPPEKIRKITMQHFSWQVSAERFENNILRSSYTGRDDTFALKHHYP